MNCLNYEFKLKLFEKWKWLWIILFVSNGICGFNERLVLDESLLNYEL